MKTAESTPVLQPEACSVRSRWFRAMKSAMSMSVVPRTGVGLDLSGDVVRVVQVRRLGREYKIVRSGSSPVEPDDTGDTRAALVAAIRKAMQSAGVTARKVIVSLPDDPAESVVRTFPKMPVEELEAVLRRDGAALHGEGMVWDYMTLPGQAGDDQRVLAAFAPGDKVSECLQILRECGLSAASISVPHIALLQIVSTPAVAGSCVALLHFSRQAVSVVILDCGVPALTRRIKNDQPASASQGYIVEEINRTFLYFKQQSRGKRVAKVILCGAGADEVEPLSRGFGVPVDDFGNGMLPWGQDAPFDAGMTVAAGLAVVGARGAEIDLVPEDIKERRTKGVQVFTLLMTAVSAVSIYIACYVALGLALETYSQALDKQQVENRMLVPIRELHREVQQVKAKLQEKEALYAELTRTSLSWPHVLWAISRVLPAEVSLSQIVVSRAGDDSGTKWMLRLSGTVSSGRDQRTRALKQLLGNMQASGIFRAVELDPVSEELVNRTMAFSLKCEVVLPDNRSS
ncbi:MAG TPA: hypothetical protein VM223_17040 [Planctomycetota bacterium]|nr:hypothetical protein [Planctomycetota bacterium]